MEIPLFPLGTVLFPGGRLALRIFETRYLDMIRRVLREGSSFGVVAIRSGSEVGEADTFVVGTLAEIVDWHRRPDGLLGIVVAGRESFRVEQRHRNADGLYVARVQLLGAESAVELPDQHAPLARLLRELRSREDADRGVTTAYDDAVWVGLRLAELLPLPTPVKQTLLETRDPLARLVQLRATLDAGGPGTPP
jgi:uncharacterized protein